MCHVFVGSSTKCPTTVIPLVCDYLNVISAYLLCFFKDFFLFSDKSCGVNS